MTDEVDYPEERIAGWIRDAIRLRLALENDREMIESLDEDDEGSPQVVAPSDDGE